MMTYKKLRRYDLTTLKKSKLSIKSLDIIAKLVYNDNKKGRCNECTGLKMI